MNNEIELTEYMQGEIVNIKSNDYGEVFYFTHKATANGKTWYKAVIPYTIQNVDALWYAEDEIQFGEMFE